MSHTVLDGLSYLECPRWHDGRIWVSDFYTHRVLSAAEDGSDLRVDRAGRAYAPVGRYR